MPFSAKNATLLDAFVFAKCDHLNEDLTASYDSGRLKGTVHDMPGAAVVRKTLHGRSQICDEQETARDENQERRQMHSGQDR